MLLRCTLFTIRTVLIAVNVIAAFVDVFSSTMLRPPRAMFSLHNKSLLQPFSLHSHRCHRTESQAQRSTRTPPPVTILRPWEQAAVAVGSAVGALINPARADFVAALGETTGGPAFHLILERMKASPEGLVCLLFSTNLPYFVLQFWLLCSVRGDHRDSVLLLISVS
jgi:hypothetical protein